MPVYEIRSALASVFDAISLIRGHYTIKVDPLSSKRVLHEYGFYYCDTLVEPHCARDRFVFHKDAAAGVTSRYSLDALIAICHDAFRYGRFHRDFNLDPAGADLRYISWLRDLDRTGNVLSLVYEEETAGFVAYSGGKLVLHALASEYRGRGLAKYLWSAACKKLFDGGCRELSSSVSAANLPALNLYATLGFRMQNALDVYHKVVE